MKCSLIKTNQYPTWKILARLSLFPSDPRAATGYSQARKSLKHPAQLFPSALSQEGRTS